MFVSDLKKLFVQRRQTSHSFIPLINTSGGYQGFFFVLTATPRFGADMKGSDGWMWRRHKALIGPAGDVNIWKHFQLCELEERKEWQLQVLECSLPWGSIKQGHSHTFEEQNKKNITCTYPKTLKVLGSVQCATGRCALSPETLKLGPVHQHFKQHSSYFHFIPFLNQSHFYWYIDVIINTVVNTE